MSIEIQGLARQFGDVRVLRGIDLSIPKGELLALLGASGSGKTTLLRILAGLDWPNAGSVRVDGQDWLALDAQRRRAGFVFQYYALFPHLTVADNVAFGLTVLPRRIRPPAAEIARKVATLLDLVQMGDYGRRFPAQLSGGQRQRVALARALAIDPDVLLLDEPFGALDAAIRKDLRGWLRGLHRKLGTTTIFVTHDQDEAFEIADRIVVFGEGRIEQVGTPDDIYERPASPFVARFLGGVNEIAADLRQGRFRVAGADASALERQVGGDGAVTLFVRPHEIDIAADGAGEGTITAVVPGSVSIRYRVSLPRQAQPVEVDLPREAARGRDLSAGTRVRVTLLRGRIFGQAARTASLAEQSLAASAL